LEERVAIVRRRRARFPFFQTGAIQAFGFCLI
jgi:hypothetical protein